MTTAIPILCCRKCGTPVGDSFLYSADNFVYHHECFPASAQQDELARLRSELEGEKAAREAAEARISGLEAANERLREALEPFAKFAEVYPNADQSFPSSGGAMGIHDPRCPIYMKDYFRARAALQPISPEGR